MGIFKVGTAELIVDYKVDKEDKEDYIYHISYYTNSIFIKDEEQIYAYRDSYLPFRVSRKVKLPTKPLEEIEEVYKGNVIEITKRVKGRIERERIKTKYSIQHPIVLLYKCRSLKDLHIGREFEVSFTKIEFTMQLKKIVSFRAGDGKVYKAYLWQSRPKGTRIWISRDEKRIPLKLESKNRFGQYSIVMVKYEGCPRLN